SLPRRHARAGRARARGLCGARRDHLHPRHPAIARGARARSAGVPPGPGRRTGLTTQDSIAALIRDTLGVAVPAPDTDLIASGLIDSLSLVSLITEIEREFRFELPLDDFDVGRFSSVERMAAFVEESRP